jgi:hypothetical protein
MPATRAYLDWELDALTTLTAKGATVHVRHRDTAEALCDVAFTREELSDMLARVDQMAACSETVRLSPGQVAALEVEAAELSTGGKPS